MNSIKISHRCGHEWAFGNGDTTTGYDNRRERACKKAIAEYKEIRPVVQFGDIYRLPLLMKKHPARQAEEHGNHLRSVHTQPVTGSRANEIHVQDQQGDSLLPAADPFCLLRFYCPERPAGRVYARAASAFLRISVSNVCFVNIPQWIPQLIVTRISLACSGWDDCSP